MFLSLRGIRSLSARMTRAGNNGVAGCRQPRLLGWLSQAVRQGCPGEVPPHEVSGLMPDPYRWAGPLLRLLPPEAAHRLTLRALAAGVVPAAGGAEDPILATRLWNLDFPNAVGLAAGFDKDAAVYGAMLRLGFG